MIRSTLITDGTSDRVLTRVIEWALWEAGVRADLVSQWADLRGLRVKPKGLRERIQGALDLYPCDLLLIHRDSENIPHQDRLTEITQALEGIENPPYVAIVPVKMQEAWLLTDEKAIRIAAGNPNGKAALKLPKINAIETIPDPKESVFKILRDASGRRGRKLQQLNVEFARTRICEQMNDFAVLRNLPSFASFEASLKAAVKEHHLDTWV